MSATAAIVASMIFWIAFVILFYGFVRVVAA
jgi:hypothetical protein